MEITYTQLHFPLSSVGISPATTLTAWGGWRSSIRPLCLSLHGRFERVRPICHFFATFLHTAVARLSLDKSILSLHLERGEKLTPCSSIGSCWATQLNLSQLFWWSCICIWPGIVVRAADLQAAVLGSIPACQYVRCNMILCNYVICILNLTKLRSN